MRVAPCFPARLPNVLQQLLAAIPAVEAFYVDHKTYAVVTFAGLRVIDPNVSEQIAFRRATDATHCAQITDGQIEWSKRGPGGAPRPHACNSTSFVIRSGQTQAVDGGWPTATLACPPERPTGESVVSQDSADAIASSAGLSAGIKNEECAEEATGRAEGW